jgi:hypothetical protein
MSLKPLQFRQQRSVALLGVTWTLCCKRTIPGLRNAAMQHPHG